MAHSVESNGIILLPVKASHLIHVPSLSLHPRDPFDRLIIAQSLVEEMLVISIDAAFDAYGVSHLW